MAMTKDVLQSLLASTDVPKLESSLLTIQLVVWFEENGDGVIVFLGSFHEWSSLPPSRRSH